VDNKEVQATLDSGREVNNRWTVDDESIAAEAGSPMVVVDLLKNKERFTGYAGFGAAQVWGAIYGQECLQGNWGRCIETRMFFRLVSGLHTSISTNIVANWYFAEEGRWGPNVPQFMRRVGEFPDRLENFYFAYLFVLRAITKAAPVLKSFDYELGSGDGESTRKQVETILDHASQSCPNTFDEEQLFADVKKHELRKQLRQQFFNISKVMQCLGCEKCRMWGKLQVAGLGAALKILVDDDGAVSLQPSDVFALFNTLQRFSEGLHNIQEMYKANNPIASRLPFKVIVPSLACVIVALFMQKISSLPLACSTGYLSNSR
jgi:ERO1-like protein alpha